MTEHAAPVKTASPICLHLVALLVTLVTAHGQGTFRNLDFESASLPILFPGQRGDQVPITNALPGWQAFLGTNAQSTVWYNTPTAGSAAVWIIGPNFEFGNPIEGNFTVLLTSGGGATGFRSASISQTGLVPNTAKSIQARIVAGTESFIFSLGDVTIPMHALSTSSNYTLYGGDVSAFGNQVAELRITAPTTPSDPFNAFRLDSIQFSNQPIPEPSVFGLFALGALLLGWSLRKKQE